jgi:hypothetical protein
MRYDEIVATLFSVLGIPVAYLASAGVILGDLSAFEAVSASVRWTFSRRHVKRFLPLALAIFALLAAQWSMETVVSIVSQYLPMAAMIWGLIRDVVDAAFAAYGAAVVAVAWLSGYFGPEHQPQTSPTPAERAI